MSCRRKPRAKAARCGGQRIFSWACLPGIFRRLMLRGGSIPNYADFSRRGARSGTDISRVPPPHRLKNDRVSNVTRQVSVARMSEAISGTNARHPHIAVLMRASVTGLDESIPFFRHPLAGDLLLYGIGARPSPDGVHEDRSANLRKRDYIVRCVDIPHGGLT